MSDKSNTGYLRHDNPSTNTTARQSLNTILETSPLSQTRIAPDERGVVVGVAPPPSPLNAALDAVAVVPVAPLLADLPKLSGTPVGGATSFVVPVAVVPFGPVAVGVAPEATGVTVGTLSVTPFSAQFCAKSVPKQIRRGRGRISITSKRRGGRTDENGEKKTQPNSNPWLSGSSSGNTETAHSMQSCSAFMFGLVQAH